MERKIKVSVIIPVYNVEEYIEKTLITVVNQTLEEIEIIVINDGSKDNSLSIVKKIMQKDSRIILIDKENEGVSKARNLGIKISKGEYIIFIDGDDWIEENYLEDTYKRAKEDNYDMVLTDMFIDYFRTGKRKYREQAGKNKSYMGKKYLDFYYSGEIVRGLCNKLIKREIFIKNNLFFLENVPSGEDMNVTIKLGYLVKKVAKINKAYYHYIQYPQSVTKQKTSNKIYPFLKAFDDIRNFIKTLDERLLEKEENRIYNYEVSSIQNFVVKDSDWKNKEYVEAVKIFIELVKNKNLDEAIQNFKYSYKILWLICKKFPTIRTVKILHYLFRWLEALKEKIYLNFYL